MCALSEAGVEFTIVTLREGVSSAVGAAALGAKAAGLTLSMDHAANVNVLFHYKPTWLKLNSDLQLSYACHLITCCFAVWLFT